VAGNILATLILMLMIGAPQVFGFAASRRAGEGARQWVWPGVAALIFAVGWSVVWVISALPSLAAGRRVWEAAGPLLIVPLAVFVPLQLLLASVIQALRRYVQHRRRTTSG
jgi:hypothetical protein